jgi:hypothetical protein
METANASRRMRLLCRRGSARTDNTAFKAICTPSIGHMHVIVLSTNLIDRAEPFAAQTVSCRVPGHRKQRRPLACRWQTSSSCPSMKKSACWRALNEAGSIAKHSIILDTPRSGKCWTWPILTRLCRIVAEFQILVQWVLVLPDF